MQTRIVLFFLCLSWQLFAQLTIEISSVPVNTPANATLYIAGNFQGWNPGDSNYALTDNGNGTYQITFTPPVGILKYKFTRGSWATVEGNANGGFLPDREFNYTGGAMTETVSILSWEDLGGTNSTAAANVSILSNNFYMPQLDRYRKIWLYLPPDYHTTGKHYPVIYMQDGQNLFDAATSFAGEWKVDESLNDLFAQGDHGCIVVGIENGGAKRIDEYSPWVNTGYNAGGEGALYIEFIAETLKPFMDTNYRTLPGRAYTCLFGSSLGGLISHYGLLERQDVFGKAGVFSPAFWFNPEIYDHSTNTDKTGDMKLFFLAGIPEGNGSVVADVNQMYSVLLNNGFEEWELNKTFHADGAHSEWYWAREFSDAYIWLFAGLNFTNTPETTDHAARLFPNPVDSFLFLKNMPTWTRPSYRIAGMDGKIHASGRLNSTQVDVRHLAPGMYVFQVISKREAVMSEKFVVKR